MTELLNQVVLPLDGRNWFKLRTPINFLVSVVACAFLVAILSLFLPFWVADLIAIGCVAYFFVLFLNKRPIGIRCTGCRKVILSNTPWVCGFCKAPNDDVDEHPFLNHCTSCSAPPKAYKCHHAHCGKVIPLTTEELQEHYAFCLNSRAELPPEPKSTLHQEQRQDLEHRITMEELDSKLAVLKKQREVKQPRTVREEVEESFNKHYDRAMAADEYAAKRRAQAAITYKDDPDGLAKANAVIDAWLRDRT